MLIAAKSEWLAREGKRALRSLFPQPILNWREARYYGRYGEVELHFVEHLCRRHQDAIDIGANEGSYIHYMRRCSRRVYAFEPIPNLAKALAKKFRRGVVVNNIALSATAGTAVLYVPVIDGMLVAGCSSISPEASATYPTHEQIEVAVDTLDNVYSGDAGFIKIDVEGHEEAVLEGARMTIARSRPRFLIELAEVLAPGAVRRVAEFFRALDYRGAFIFRRQLLPIEWFDPALMQRPEDLPDLKANLDERERFGPYIYNFLFLPADEAEEVSRRVERRLAEL